ncbi:MAG: hypothetical protein QM770_03975 [Tepidisphaeraceae bacterium]
MEHGEGQVSPANDRVADGLMPVWLHMVLFVCVSFAGAFGLMFIGQRISDRFALSSGWANLVVGVALLIGFNGAGLSWLKLVSARCAKCRGRALGKFNSEGLAYRCERCGHIRQTRLNAD